MPPVVSVITAAYNSSRTLRIALSTLMAQTFEHWEAWIVGDGCTDDSEAVVQSFGDRRLHWENLPTNHGSQAFPNNHALRRAQGQYIAYLGHDDLWMPNHLADLVGRIEETGADFVHSICGLFGPQGWDRICVGPPRGNRSYENHFVPPSSWLHRRSMVQTVGYWGDPDRLSRGVDFDYMRRMARAGTKISFCARLTALKIISSRIGLYSFKGAPPQEALWERIQADREQFEREMLGLAATELAKLQNGGDEPLSLALRRVLAIVKHRIQDTFEEYPLISAYQRSRYQHKRRFADRRARGLPVNASTR